MWWWSSSLNLLAARCAPHCRAHAPLLPPHAPASPTPPPQVKWKDGLVSLEVGGGAPPSLNIFAVAGATNGSALSWGTNVDGELGLGAPLDYLARVPTPVRLLLLLLSACCCC